MSKTRYFWLLVVDSFHGTVRVAAITELLIAIVVGTVGYFSHEWEERLKVLFVFLVGLLILTFFCGIFLAAYRAQQKEHDLRTKAEEDSRARKDQGAVRRGLNGLTNTTIDLRAKLEGIETHPGDEKQARQMIRAVEADYQRWVDGVVKPFVAEHFPDDVTRLRGCTDLDLPEQPPSAHPTDLEKKWLLARVKSVAAFLDGLRERV